MTPRRKEFNLLGTLFNIGIYVRTGSKLFDEELIKYLSCDKNFNKLITKRKYVQTNKRG